MEFVAGFMLAQLENVTASVLGAMFGIDFGRLGNAREGEPGERLESCAMDRLECQRDAAIECYAVPACLGAGTDDVGCGVQPDPTRARERVDGFEDCFLDSACFGSVCFGC
jgi:hypothetical protein